MSTSSGQQDADASTKQQIDIIKASHAEIASLYFNLERIDEVYHQIFQLIGNLCVHNNEEEMQSLQHDALHFYGSNYFKVILFMLNRTHELSSKIDHFILLSHHLNIGRLTDEKLIKQAHLTNALFPQETAFAMTSDCRDWKKGAINILKYMFESLRCGVTPVHWKVHSYTYLKESVEFRIMFRKSNTASTVLSRENCPFVATEICSFLKLEFVPEFDRSNLVSQVTMKLIAKRLSDSQSFGRNHDAWTKLITTTNTIPKEITAISTAVGDKRKVDDEDEEFDGPISKKRPFPSSSSSMETLQSSFGVKQEAVVLTKTSPSPPSSPPPASFAPNVPRKFPDVHFSPSSESPFRSRASSPSKMASSSSSSSSFSATTTSTSTTITPLLDKCVVNSEDGLFNGEEFSTKKETTANSFNWRASFSGGSSSSSLRAEDSDENDDDDCSNSLFGESDLIDLTEVPDSVASFSSDLDSDCDSDREAHQSQTPVNSVSRPRLAPVDEWSSTQQPPLPRSPSRRGFDDSTLEFSPTQSEDCSSSDDASVWAGVEVKSVSVEHANSLYENLVHVVGRNLLRTLCRASKSTMRIATDLSRCPEANRRSSHEHNRMANEKTKMFLTEAIMEVTELSSELISMQSRLLLASSLKDQRLDPRCNGFRSKDGHFKVQFPVYERLVTRNGLMNTGCGAIRLV
jgi:hypothetical protein